MLQYDSVISKINDPLLYRLDFPSRPIEETRVITLAKRLPEALQGWLMTETK